MAASYRPPNAVLVECYGRARGDLTIFVRELRTRSWNPPMFSQAIRWFETAQRLVSWNVVTDSDTGGGPDDAA